MSDMRQLRLELAKGAADLKAGRKTIIESDQGLSDFFEALAVNSGASEDKSDHPAL